MPLVVDPAFRSVKDKPDGICIWRIEVGIVKEQNFSLNFSNIHAGEIWNVTYTDKLQKSVS
jgi:hypothetical protein